MLNEPFIRLIPYEKLQQFEHPSDPSNSQILSRYRRHLVETSEIWVWINLVETALATSMSRELETSFGNDWLNNPEFRRIMGSDLDAFADKQKRKSANLTFGFWTMLLQDNREKDLWVPLLHKAFTTGTSRKNVYKHARTIRKIRNKIAHHDLLPENHQAILKDAVRKICDAFEPGFAEYVLLTEVA